MVQEIIYIIANIIGYLAGLIVLYGIIISLYHFIRSFKDKKHYPLDDVRIRLGRHLILALEFLIGRDIILTLGQPSYEVLGLLAFTIAIRVTLSYFLHRELHELKKRGQPVS